MRTTGSAAPTPPPGLRVGEYRLLARIGEGGMGVVHLAQGPDGRRVALKVLRPHIIGDDEARERLAREVASLRRVRSPRVAGIIDADPWGDTPFVATRYVPGLSLHEHVREEGPVSGEDLRYLAAGLAEAVLAVHAVGVLHRDIKPSNVLMEGRAPVLIDFGLARLADDPRLTMTGWLLGTPGYLAPEILYGDDPTTAADVHAWAATVAFAATGNPPFGRGPAVAVMDRVRRGEYDVSGVPGELVPVLEAALSPDPESRPTLTALLADLRPRPPRPLAVPDEATMPLALASSRPDPDATEAVPADVPTGVLADQPTEHLDEARTVAETIVDGHAATSGGPPGAVAPPTTPLTSLQPAARAPYEQPRPPSTAPVPGPGGGQGAWQGLAALQRGLMLSGLFALVVVGFAWTPYLCVLATAAGALAVRTWSWTAQGVRERTWRRGRRWYDVPLAALSSPWYLLVATAGTLVLLIWAVALAVLAGLALLAFRAPVTSGMLLVGSVLALALWWGPASRRLRVPTRSVLSSLTQRATVGWVGVGVVGLAVAGAAYALATTGTSWEPMPGAPWRPGTLLGDLARWL